MYLYEIVTIMNSPLIIKEWGKKRENQFDPAYEMNNRWA